MTDLEIKRQANRLTQILPDSIRAEVMAMTPEYIVDDVVIFGENTDHPEVMVLLTERATNTLYTKSYYGTPSIRWTRGSLINCSIRIGNKNE